MQLVIETLQSQVLVDRSSSADKATLFQHLAKNATKIIADIEIGVSNSKILRQVQSRVEPHQHRTIASRASLPQEVPASDGTAGFSGNSVGSRLDYLLECYEKERMWMMNYKDQVDVALRLLTILVSQQDAQNNIHMAEQTHMIAVASRWDSRAMVGIALLTTFFLPATFFAVSSTHPCLSEPMDLDQGRLTLDTTGVR
jgi:hypothetical protein